jgi:hypothetical protein
MPMDWGLARDYAARDVHPEETHVTEAEWLACTDPIRMLDHLGSRRKHDPRLEFLIAAPEQDQRHVELLFMVAWYHRRHGLGTGHTLPIGEPGPPVSKCDFFLVSLPYPFGPQSEVCNFRDWHLHVLWLLPITGAERDSKVREGLEALEQRFDTCAMEYWVPGRPSAV